ncbi:MAG: DNA methyltransferase [Methyloceanibacter sp.]
MRKRDKAQLLYQFHEKLAGMRFLDPACGCGNFLIITYRELRQLELEVLRELRTSGQLEIIPERLSKIDVDRFYGIEIEEFPARIAETALWMMDHVMNNRLSLEFGQVYARIPLKTAPHIRNADALEFNWADLLDPAHCTAVLGNPPYGGFVFRNEQRQTQMAEVQRLAGAGGRIDYSVAWFLKAGAYVQRGTAAIAFVATNSITQGEQVAQVWPILFEHYGLEIAFAHRTFAWGSDARGMAHVHVVIIGLTRREQAPAIRRLFSYDDIDGDPVESRHKALSPYLFDAEQLTNRHLVVQRSRRPLNDLPAICVGSKPVDGGHYIFDDEERKLFLAREPNAAPIMRPFIGSWEYINGVGRWILFPAGMALQELRRLPAVMERVATVRAYRSQGGNLARELADQPTQYHVTVVPTAPFLSIPEVSSERREYVPIGWLEPPTIPSNQLLIVQNATVELFALLVSKMHMVWLAYIGGRLESRYRYSGGIVYNTFPVPRLDDRSRAKLVAGGQAILDARSAHPGATLADLYDPDAMPTNLRQAHRALDAVVDRLYKRGGFSHDRERVEHLFGLYESLTARLPMAEPKRARRGRRAGKKNSEVQSSAE